MKRQSQDTAVVERVMVVDPVEDELWAELSGAHGKLFGSAPWLGALRDTYAFDIEALVVVDANGEVAGGLPVARLGTDRWRRLSTLPFSDYCNAIDVEGSAWPLLAEALVAEELPVELRHLGEDGPHLDARFDPVNPPDLWHAVDLDEDEERAWSALPGSARRAIRKARDSEVEVRASDDLGSLRSFYELHLRTRKDKYRLLAQPYEFFTALHKRFGEQMILLGAWHAEKLIAGILLLSWNDTIYYKFNASSPEALDIRPNDLLMWEAMRLGVSREMSVLDLGRTDSDHESLARYKLKYATAERPIHTLRLGTYRRDPAVGEILGPVTELLTRPEVPDDIVEEAGSLLYHHFA